MMSLTVSLVLATACAPGAEDWTVEEAGASTPAEPGSDTHDDPSLTWSDDGLTVARPAYGMEVRGVHKTKGGRPSFELAPKDWNQLVRENPELARYQRRSRFVGPGVAGLVIGGSWLALSSVLAWDGYYARSATGALFQWGAPVASIATGALMTVVGIRARQKLRKAQREFYFSPYASRTQAGASLSVRF